MIKYECDDCKKPIDVESNHFHIPQMIIVDSGKIFQPRNLHFCGKPCLDSWLVKNMNRPNMVPPTA